MEHMEKNTMYAIISVGHVIGVFPTRTWAENAFHKMRCYLADEEDRKLLGVEPARIVEYDTEDELPFPWAHDPTPNDGIKITRRKEEARSWPWPLTVLEEEYPYQAMDDVNEFYAEHNNKDMRAEVIIVPEDAYYIGIYRTNPDAEETGIDEDTFMGYLA